MRTVRVKLYKDPVFLIAHEAVRPLLKSTDLVTLFVSAQNFAAYLMANGIMDEEFLLYEFIIAKTICTNFQNEMCKNRHFFVVCLPVLEYHLKGF